jgi:hypothetical protein
MDQAALDPVVLEAVEQMIGPGAQFSIAQATEVHPAGARDGLPGAGQSGDVQIGRSLRRDQLARAAAVRLDPPVHSRTVPVTKPAPAR